MNSRRPSSVTAVNGREPFVTTLAGSTEATGSPADRSAAAIPSDPIRRSGTPKATSTAAPTVTPEANARTSSAGRTVPVISRAAATAASAIHAVRRQGRLSHGAAATVTATAAASRAGPGNAALASQELCPAAAVTACGCLSPARYRMPASTAPAVTAPAARPASRRNRRWRRVAATATAAARTKCHLHQAGQQPSGRVRSEPGHGGRAGARQPIGSQRDCGEHPGQDQSAADQADDIARMTVTSRRQEPPWMLRDRLRSTG